MLHIKDIISIWSMRMKKTQKKINDVWLLQKKICKIESLMQQINKKSDLSTQQR